MWNWLKRKLGIPALVQETELLHKDLNKAFNRIERLEKTTRLGKRSMRYDEIERARKRRYKGWPKKAA